MLFRSKNVIRASEIRIHEPTLRLVVTCGSKARALSTRDEIIVHKCETTIYGPRMENGVWRTSENNELKQIYGDSGILGGSE